MKGSCYSEGYGRMMARNRSDSVEQKAEKYGALFFQSLPSGRGSRVNGLIDAQCFISRILRGNFSWFISMDFKLSVRLG